MTSRPIHPPRRSAYEDLASEAAASLAPGPAAQEGSTLDKVHVVAMAILELRDAPESICRATRSEGNRRARNHLPGPDRRWRS